MPVVSVEKANSFAVKDIQDNASEVTFDAPEGLVTISGEMDPYLKSYPWPAATPPTWCSILSPVPLRLC